MNDYEAGPMYKEGDLVLLAPEVEWKTMSGQQLGGAWVQVIGQIRWDTSGDHDKWMYYVRLEDQTLWNVGEVHISEDLMRGTWSFPEQVRLI